MTVKTSTFGGQLRHFAQTVDVVDDAIFNRVRSLVFKYVMHELNGEYFELFKQEISGDGIRRYTLQTFWSSSTDKNHSWPISGNNKGTVKGVNDSHINPVTIAFRTHKPVWVVSPDKAPLDVAETYQDMWSHTPNMPRYDPSSNQPIRTLIVMPLYFRGDIGAFCIESSQYIEITDVAKLELCTLAEGLAILYRLWEVNKAHSESKDSAINDLSDLLDHSKFPKLAKPHCFVAYSHSADDSVKFIINDALKDFSDRLEFTDWSKMNKAGSITAQISKEISESRFGICYLSEPVGSSPRSSAQAYDDNRNVVFEAGMLHARTSASADEDEHGPSGWIPIREENSPEAPFDFASERILYVPRAKDGELNEPKLRTMLSARINSMLIES